jgi:hypothetical protein
MVTAAIFACAMARNAHFQEPTHQVRGECLKR